MWHCSIQIKLCRYSFIWCAVESTLWQRDKNKNVDMTFPRHIFAGTCNTTINLCHILSTKNMTSLSTHSSLLERKISGTLINWQTSIEYVHNVLWIFICLWFFESPHCSFCSVKINLPKVTKKFELILLPVNLVYLNIIRNNW